MILFAAGFFTCYFLGRFSRGRYVRSTMARLRQHSEARDKALAAALEKIDTRATNYELDARVLNDLQMKYARCWHYLETVLTKIGASHQQVLDAKELIETGSMK